MIPVLQDLAKTNMKDCVQAIFLYPLNALMKSQQKRIHAWCTARNKTSDKETSTSDSIYQSDYAQLYVGTS